MRIETFGIWIYRAVVDHLAAQCQTNAFEKVLPMVSIGMSENIYIDKINWIFKHIYRLIHQNNLYYYDLYFKNSE